MILLAIKLLIAHIIGDFVLQPNSWVEHKKNYKHASKFLYFHGLVHSIALLLILQFDWSYLPYILLIVISHLIIDLIKINLEGTMNTRLLFALDQTLHLIIISIVVYLNNPFLIDFGKIYSEENLLFILMLLLVIPVSSIVMKMMMSKWKLEDDNSEDSLPNAGAYIGVLERLFVFGFIVLNQWGAIGFLIAAKSVFRFGDLSRAKNRKLTEYVLIGTLTSFGLAISLGLLYTYFTN